MIQTVVFSKDRAAQLDLLLRSIEERATGVLDVTDVIYAASNQAFQEAYEICMDEHPGVFFLQEEDFRDDVWVCLDDRPDDAGDQVCFLCDDDLVVRSFTESLRPNTILEMIPDVLCVSLRLGANTTNCYPLRREQKTPSLKHGAWEPEVRIWDWTTADGDWGYPGSLDGHVFSRNMLRAFLNERPFHAPNRLEEILVDCCGSCVGLFPFMACYESSLLTGVPVNRVQDTHPNRAGDYYPQEPELLNATYLGGKRLRLTPIEPSLITGAHTELPLAFA